MRRNNAAKQQTAILGYIPDLTDFTLRRVTGNYRCQIWRLVGRFEPSSSDLVIANGSGKIKVPGLGYWPNVGLAVWNPPKVADCFSPRSQTSVAPCFMLCSGVSQAMRLVVADCGGTQAIATVANRHHHRHFTVDAGKSACRASFATISAIVAEWSLRIWASSWSRTSPIRPGPSGSGSEMMQEAPALRD